MESIYPPSPDVVRDELTAPGPTYKRQARVALLSLLLFIVLYLSLTAWFGWTAYSYFVNAAGSDKGPFIAYGLAATATFLTVFLVKALFFVNHGGEPNDLEVTADEQPQLFEFLYRLADEAGAPRPHRVFLSGRVNAAVFYDLTLLNLIFPSKKNLEIGLALVNGLNLGEFKAVLAHEFGHFRQGSMAVGRWVYVAQQVANHIIYQRDIIDRFLVGLSRFDIRIAWIGWILRLIVWSLRAILDTAFSLVVLAQRSLSREMEFHADMVSVSLTGSDALVHALHRLGAADDAWSRALGVAGQELAAGRAVTDVFVIQKIITSRMKDILDDENHDCPPPFPDSDRAQHRVFAQEEAHPPQMWSTHPPNRDREENAKKQYILANIDERPAWDVFKDPQKLREQMTEHLLSAGVSDGNVTKSALTETVANVNKLYGKVVYDRRYRGCYMGRSVVREFEQAGDAIGSVDTNVPVVEQFAGLYPESLSDEFEHWRNLEEEKETLRSLRDGHLVPPDGVIRHRGQILKKSQLPDAISDMRDECDAARKALAEHDRHVRGVHASAAQTLGNGWQAYHHGLVQLLHYADHTAANLADVQTRLANLWSVVIADGKVSSGEVKQLLVVANDMHSVLVGVDADAKDVILSNDLAARLQTNSWRALLSEEFGLPEPVRDNLGDWLGAADSWVNYFLDALSTLQSETLEVLLQAESQIETLACAGGEVVEAPTPAAVPARYPLLLPNTERKLQRRLGLWDRFQTADGLFPALARFGVAAVIIGGVLGIGAFFSSAADVVVYNGLATSVSVEAGGERVELAPMSHAELSVPNESDLTIASYSRDGQLIHTIDVDASNAFKTHVYNVAAAAPLMRWTASYGSSAEEPPEVIGASAWMQANVDFLFEEPPDSINTSGSGGTRTVLSGFEDLDPRYLDNYLPEGSNSDAIVRAHARWDHPNAPYTLMWISLSSTLDDFPETLEHRLERDATEVLSLRFEQDSAEDDAARAAVCERHSANAASNPSEVAWKYLAIRCMQDSPAQGKAFIDAYAEHPEYTWIAGAAGYSFAELAEWEPAIVAFESAFEGNRGMRIAYADEIARARRMARGEQADVSDLVSASPWLQSEVMITSDEVQTHPQLVSYQRLWQGDLSGAIEEAQYDPDFAAEMLRMAAASDGATRQIIADASALDPGEGISGDSLWPAIGFAKRHGLSTQAMLDEASEWLDDEADMINDFVVALNDPAAAERALRGARSKTRGQAYALGVVALGSRAPQAWRDGAKRLLYATERPYFR